MCWKCGRSIDTTETIYRDSVCPECGADLRCCRNCKYYAPGAHYDCRETVQELVLDKEEANFCDNFSPKTGFLSENREVDEAKKARDAFNSLFGGLICV
ncbi:MAG: hypothetical protein M0P01_05415 [Treponema sp.]|nr:hypothetical protein [Treponema sp.]